MILNAIEDTPIGVQVRNAVQCAARTLDGIRCGARRALTADLEDEPCPSEGYELSCRAVQPVATLGCLPGGRFASIIPGESVAEAVITSGVAQTLSLYQSALIVRLILTWFPNPPQALVSPLATICDPYLNLFRGIIPPLGGTIDLSPILAFVVLDVIGGSAAALPAEMPSKETGVQRDAKRTTRA